jgi:hypothetical protein
MATPKMHRLRLISSYLDIASPKNRNAIMVAKIGEVLLRKATFEREIIFMAILKTKKVMVPKIDLIITRRHCSSEIAVRFTLSFLAMNKEISS